MEGCKKLSWIEKGKKQSTNRNKGQATEALALDYLLKQGLRLERKNFHSRQGEIDIVMRDAHTYVFVEVKYRKSGLFGGAISAISYNKEQKIRKCAKFYLQQNDLNEYNTPCRFDVIALEGDINQPQITWLRNAF